MVGLTICYKFIVNLYYEKIQHDILIEKLQFITVKTLCQSPANIQDRVGGKLTKIKIINN